MRDMHKWKDKVELALDNRQIFFLFFGLSVIGCFVFALGVMVGRRSADGPQVARADAAAQDSLAMLDRDEALAVAPVEIAEPEGFAFKDGLAQPATEGLPETRDPEVPPRPEAELKKAEPKKVEAKKAEPKKVEAKKAEPKPEPKKVEKPAPAPVVKKVEDKPVAPKPVPTALVKDPQDKPLSKEQVLAANGHPAPEKATAGKTFTLQMKAFSKQEDADKLAEKLRKNGHDVRVESAELHGRMWHRVRVGEFTDWDAALAAKQEFEKREQIIAYVVRN
ncbi:MAG: SPOR domain-containing protein [Myxococcales bacterium]|nr:SPOR domain-containing protein [Myxococcales bacterium]